MHIGPLFMACHKFQFKPKRLLANTLTVKLLQNHFYIDFFFLTHSKKVTSFIKYNIKQKSHSVWLYFLIPLAHLSPANLATTMPPIVPPPPLQESVCFFSLFFSLNNSTEWMLAVTSSQHKVPNVGFVAWTKSDPRSSLFPAPWLLELPKILEAIDMEGKKGNTCSIEDFSGSVKQKSHIRQHYRPYLCQISVKQGFTSAGTRTCMDPDNMQEFCVWVKSQKK